MPFSNYLHHGNALECWRLLGFPDRHGLHSKRALVKELGSCGGDTGHLAQIIQSYGPRRTRTIDVDRLRADFAATARLRERFRALNCRGFSYKIDCDITLAGPHSQEALPLRREINLRLALMSSGDLFYPPRVRHYLRRFTRSHYSRDGFPAIGFALGIRARTAWYVLTLQSDLAFGTSAYVQAHFRGWRKVLFANLLSAAAADDADTVYLCTAQDVLRACHPGYYSPVQVPRAWECIYDRTAADFHMRPVRLRRPLNIQLFSRQKAVYTTRFYELRLTPDRYDAVGRGCSRAFSRSPQEESTCTVTP